MPDLSEGQGTVNRNLEACMPKDNLVISSPPPTPAENTRLCQGAEGQVEACAGGGHDDKKVRTKELECVQEKTPILESSPLRTLQEVRDVEPGAEGLVQDEIDGEGDVLDGGQCAGDDHDDCVEIVEIENVIQGVQEKIISDKVKIIEQRAGVLQGAGDVQCDPGFVTKDVQEKMNSSPLQTPQGVTTVEQ